MTESLTPTESRQRLAVLRDRAIAAGLGDLVRSVDARLLLAAAIEIDELGKALAEVPPLTAEHTTIVEQLDTLTPEPAAIPAPRRPGISAPPASVLPRPKMPPRRPTGPDAADLEIPV